MSIEGDFKFACLEEYYGDDEMVLKQIYECKECGAKMVFTHLPDYKNLLIQENPRCLDCGHGGIKTIHILN